jgi:multiple sugar transport system substrate-binding protein
MPALAAASACARSRFPRDGRTHLTFLAWGDGEEWSAFEDIVADYHRVQQRVRIHLDQVSYKFTEHLQIRLAAGVGPDLFRVSYMDLGRFTPSGSLIDLTPHLPPETAAQFTPTLWSSVLYGGRPHALPHHTDTSALLCNQKLFKSAGIPLPRTIEEAWTWEQFLDISRALQSRKLCDFGFAMNWTYEGAFRWMNFLYQHGGQLLTDDLRRSAVPSAASLETLVWTRNWFTDRLTPANASTKTGESVHQLWLSGVTGMQFGVGVNDVRLFPPEFPWSLTFLPRDRAIASELGGNAVGVSRDCQSPEAAVDFLLFLTNADNMRRFCERSQYLPARADLVRTGIAYPYRPEEMRVFVEQAAHLPEHLARTEAVPGFDRINQKLADGLNACFSGAKTPEQTLDRLSIEIRRALI